MRWKRALGWTVLANVITVGGCALALEALLPDDFCGTQVFAQTTSPDGKRRAVVYEIDCGATTGFSRQLAILPADRDFDVKSPPKGFFAITLRQVEGPALSMRESLVQTSWLSDTRLDIAYPADANVIRSTERLQGIEMRYRTYLNATKRTEP